MGWSEGVRGRVGWVDESRVVLVFLNFYILNRNLVTVIGFGPNCNVYIGSLLNMKPMAP